MGIYLPMALTLLIPLGALLGYLYNRWAQRSGNFEFKERLGVLMATGLIVGESLFGVLGAGIIAATGKDAPLAVAPDSFTGAATWIGVIAFAAIIGWLYRRTQRTSMAAED